MHTTTESDELTPVAVLAAGDSGRPFERSAVPSLRWQARTGIRGWWQRSAELELRRPGQAPERAAVVGGESVGVRWPWAPLAPYDRVEVRVRVTGEDGSTSPWSAPTAIVTGPLSAGDWAAAFIADPRDSATGDDDRGITRFRHDLRVERPLARAVLSYTAHGAVRVFLDGEQVDDEELAPGWTPYRERLLFSTIDVTERLEEGAHVLGAVVGPGWYGERLGFDGNFRRTWTGPRALSIQLRLEYADGDVELVTTGEGWSATTDGPWRFASIYQGERFDARAEDRGLELGGVLAGAVPAIEVDADPGRLAPADRPAVRVIETREPVAVIAAADGGTILDFGQNLVGRVRVRVRGERGAELVLRHAEVLEQGELATRPLRTAAATDRYVLSGSPDGEEWAPSFTFHGFRYAQISGLPIESITASAEVLHSDVPRRGWLHTGVEELDRLHENIVWTIRGNIVSIPTDCPQRDERLGWTGDAELIAPSAAFLFDLSGFLGSWMRDIAAEQRRHGGIPPLFVPYADNDHFPVVAQAVWCDVVTVVPDVLYRHHGDLAELGEHYEGMRDWIEQVRARAGDGLWDAGRQLGDWLDPSAPPDRPFQAMTPTDIVANAYYCRSVELTARAARALGRAEEADEWERLAAALRELYQARFVAEDGSVESGTQTAYALTISFGLIPEHLLAAAGELLAAVVEESDYRIATGIVGTAVVCDALTRSGQRRVAQRMLMNRELPGWLYPLTMGATTVWERWDSMLPDGSVNPGSMTSFNHYALGSIADWMHREIGGIEPIAPGGRRIRIRPRAGVTTSASARLDTAYGAVEVSWRALEPERGPASPIELVAVVPPNATAAIDLPGRDVVELGSGTHRIV